MQKLLSVLIFFTTVGYAATDFTWNSTTNLSDIGTQVPIGDVVSNGTNTAISIWARYSGSTWVVESDYSTNNGENWNLPQTAISAISTSQPIPKISLNDSNYAVAVFQTFDGVNTYTIQQAYTSDGGIHWTTSLSPLATSSDAITDPHVALEPENTAISVWTGSDGSGHTIIQAKYSSDAGVTWSSVLDLSSTGAQTPEVAINSTLEAVAIWENGGVIQYTSSTDGGETWSTVDNISLLPDASEPKLAFCGIGNAVAVWKRNNGTHDVVESSYSFNGGATWSDPIVISDDSQNADVPQVSMNDDGAVIITWQSDNGSPAAIQYAYSFNGGNAFSDPITLSPLTENCVEPKVSINDDGVASIVFTNATHHQIQVSSSLDEGETFTPVQNMSYSVGEATHPSVVVNDQDFAILFWSFQVDTSYITQSIYGNFFNVSFAQHVKKLLLQRDIVNELSWETIPDASLYRVYLDEDLTMQVYENPSPSYFDHGQKKGETKTYYVTWADFYGEESSAVEISGP
jgi:hypothetical protein